MGWVDELAFRIRGAVPWSLPAFKRVRSFEAFSATLGPAAASRARELATRFELATWSRCCDEQEWRESLYALDVFAQHLPRALPEGRAAEIGAKNGSMLPALATFSGRGCDAIELDAHRRYAFGSTRRVYGEALARHFEGSRFHAADVRDVAGPWALVTWWLPFLTEGPLEAWGLPRRFLAPAALLEHVKAQVAPGGALFVVNQGAEEGALQGRLFEQLSMRATSVGRVESVLSPFQRERVGWLWRNA